MTLGRNASTDLKFLAVEQTLLALLLRVVN